MIRKISTLLLLFFSLAAASQESCFKIAKNYYRSDPFVTEFSTFISHLLKDPTLKDVTIHKKTDSSLFFFNGTYNTHNPFFFPGSTTKITLAEREEEIMQDSVLQVYPYYVYQLIGYAPQGEEGMKSVKEEYLKFCKKYKKGFERVTVKKIENSRVANGELTEFQAKGLNIPLLSAAWSGSVDQKENLFAITLCFWVDENKAWLPIPSDSL